MRAFAAIVVAGIMALSLSSCATESHTTAHATTFKDVAGYVSVPRQQVTYDPHNGVPCVASTGYSDIQQGAQVTVANASGTIIATAQLRAGVVADLSLSDPLSGSCQFVFYIDSLKHSDFYSVKVGNAVRGSVQFTAADARHRAFDISIN